VESSSLSPPASVVLAIALLFRFPFSFSFIVFCILHCSAKWTVDSELIHCLMFPLHANTGEWSAFGVFTVPWSITAALLLPFPFSFSFVWAALHYSHRMWTVESEQPPTFPPSLSPSPPRSPSPSSSFGLLSTVHVACEQWRVSPLFMVEPIKPKPKYIPKPKCIGPVWLSKIKKSKFFSQILCFIKKTGV